MGKDEALCVFNNTIFTNATVMSDTVILCDSPSLLNKHGYSDVPEGGALMYKVDVSLDGGLQISNGTAIFNYYSEPIVTRVIPALGPLRAGTNVTIYGKGFGQTAACKRVISLGHV